MIKLKPAEYYHSLPDGYNNGEPRTIVPYEVILFNNGIICKKSPHPVIASHALICKESRTGITHDSWPFGFNFITFHYIGADHEERVDFIETVNLFPDNQKYMFEACSDLEIGDGECPRFRHKEQAFIHCMKLIEKEFDIKPAENNTNRCIKK